jgi:hypothetical protein
MQNKNQFSNLPWHIARNAQDFLPSDIDLQNPNTTSPATRKPQHLKIDNNLKL